MGHRAATMSLFHWVFSFAIVCASPHDKPISLSSVSTVFLQVVLGLPLFLLPAAVHLRATLGILSDDIRKTCPSHLSRRFLISRSILVLPVFWYRSLLEILLGQKMLQILRRQLLWKTRLVFGKIKRVQDGCLKKKQQTTQPKMCTLRISELQKRSANLHS